MMARVPSLVLAAVGERPRPGRRVRPEGRAVVAVLDRLPHHRRLATRPTSPTRWRSRSASSSSCSSRGSWCGSRRVLIGRLVKHLSGGVEKLASMRGGVSFVDTGPDAAGAPHAAGGDDRRGAAQHRHHHDLVDRGPHRARRSSASTSAPLIAAAGIAGVALGFGAQSLVQRLPLRACSCSWRTSSASATSIDTGVGLATGHRRGREPAHDAPARHRRRRVARPERRPSCASATSRSSGRARWSTCRSRSRPTPAAATEVIRDVADEVWHDPEFASIILAEPSVLGVESLAPGRVVIRVVVRTQPAGAVAGRARAAGAHQGRARRRRHRAAVRVGHSRAAVRRRTRVGPRAWTPPLVVILIFVLAVVLIGARARAVPSRASAPESRSPARSPARGPVAPTAPSARRTAETRRPPRRDRGREAAPRSRSSSRSRAPPELRERLGKTRGRVRRGCGAAAASTTTTWDDLEDTLLLADVGMPDHRADPRRRARPAPRPSASPTPTTLIGAAAHRAGRAARVERRQDRARSRTPPASRTCGCSSASTASGRPRRSPSSRSARRDDGHQRRARRRRHVPRRGRRAARALGRAHRRRASCAARRAPTPARSSSTR